MKDFERKNSTKIHGDRNESKKQDNGSINEQDTHMQIEKSYRQLLYGCTTHTYNAFYKCI